MKKLFTGLPLLALLCFAVPPAKADTPPNFEAMRAAAQQGDPDAEAALADFYADGQNGSGPDFAEAAKWYGKAAAQGDAESANALGDLYDSGQGVPQDLARAAKWYRQAALQGNAAAEYALGGYYEHGLSVAPDAVAAAQWYRQAAFQGNTSAQWALSDYYAEGTGVPKDNARADFWAHVALRQEQKSPAPQDGENNSAQENNDRLAKIESQMPPSLIAGVQRSVAAWQPAEAPPYAPDAVPGASIDDAADERSLESRAARGELAAEYVLGNLYDEGRGVQRDYGKAFGWFRNAANSGFAPAQVSLAWYFEHGRAVPQDDTVAERWYQTAAAQGSEPARLAYARLTAPHIDAPDEQNSARNGEENAAAVPEERAAERAPPDDAENAPGR